MTEQQIEEGNVLIAEFMQYNKLESPHKDFVDWHIPGWGWSKKWSLKFHDSWDWLMPVVEKIGKDYSVRITWLADGIEVTYIDRPDVDDDSIADFGGHGSLTNTWKCVVKFIKWHDQKFKNKKKK